MLGENREKPEGMSDYDWYQIRSASQDSLYNLEGYKSSYYNMLSLFDRSWNNSESIDRLIYLLNALVYKDEKFSNTVWEAYSHGEYGGGYIDGDKYVLNGINYPVALTSNNEIAMTLTLNDTDEANLKVFLDEQEVTKLNGHDVKVFRGYSLTYTTPGGASFSTDVQGYDHINKTAKVWVDHDGYSAQYIVDYSDPDPENLKLYYEYDNVEVSEINGQAFTFSTDNSVLYLYTGTTTSYPFYYNDETTIIPRTIYTYLYVKQDDDVDNWKFYLNPDFSGEPITSINNRSLSVQTPENNGHSYRLVLIDQHSNIVESSDLVKYALITDEQGGIIARVNISATSLGYASNTTLNTKLNEILTVLNDDFGFGFNLTQGLTDKLTEVRTVLFGGEDEGTEASYYHADGVFMMIRAKEFFEAFIDAESNEILSDNDIEVFELIAEAINQQIKKPLIRVINKINAKLIAYGYNEIQYSDTSSAEDLLDILKNVLQIETYEDLVRNLYIRNKIYPNIRSAMPNNLFLGENDIGDLALLQKMIDTPSYMFQMLAGHLDIYIPGLNSYLEFNVSYYEDEVIDWFNTAFNDKEIFTEDQKAWVMENLYDNDPDTEGIFDFNPDTMRRFILHVDKYEEKVNLQNFITIARYDFMPLAFSLPYLFSGEQLQSIGLGLLEMGMQKIAAQLAAMAG